mgnify:CR=1 FL=1
MDGITGIELEGLAANADCLPAFADEMHLDPAPVTVIEGMVRKGFDIEITRQFAIDTSQEIQIEGSGHTVGIVVGSIQNVHVFLQVDPDQQAATRAGYIGKTGQKLSLIHISEPTRLNSTSRMPSSA